MSFATDKAKGLVVQIAEGRRISRPKGMNHESFMASIKGLAGGNVTQNRPSMFSHEEINVLHDLVVRAIDTNSGSLPECTWTDDCLTCNLYEKIYNMWKVCNGDVS